MRSQRFGRISAPPTPTMTATAAMRSWRSRARFNYSTPAGIVRPATSRSPFVGDPQPHLAVELEVCRVDPAAHRCGTIEDTARRPQSVLEFALPTERLAPLLPMPDEDGVVQRAPDQRDEAKRLRKLLHALTVPLSRTSA